MQLNRLERLAVIIVVLTFGCGLLALAIGRDDKSRSKHYERMAAEQRPEFLRLNLNKADARELVALPGIGKKRAEAIVRLRKQIGGFKKLDDLLKVKGIGRKTLEQIRPYVCVGGEVAEDL